MGYLLFVELNWTVLCLNMWDSGLRKTKKNRLSCLPTKSKDVIVQFSSVTSAVSDSVRPHRRQPTRLRHPWDPPGKNTGVGFHFLLQCMKVKSESEVAQSCPTLSSRMDCSLPGSSVHGICQARVLEWGAIALSKRCHKRCIKKLNKYVASAMAPICTRHRGGNSV